MTATTGAGGLDLPRNARALLDAVLAISSDLDLHSVLDRIVVAACEITGARYGALGVLDDAGGLSDFLTIGLDEEEHRKIGDLPQGHGILGAAHRPPAAAAARRTSRSTRSPTASRRTTRRWRRFLGVPVRIRGTVFGNLYLTEKAGGDEFTEQDEVLVVALATHRRVRDRERPRLRAQRAAAAVAGGLGPAQRRAAAADPCWTRRSAGSRWRRARVSGAAMRSRCSSAVTTAATRSPPSPVTAPGPSTTWPRSWPPWQAHIEQAETQTDLLVVALGRRPDRRCWSRCARTSPSSGVLLVVRAERGVLEIEETRAARLVRRPGVPVPGPHPGDRRTVRSWCWSPTGTGSPATCTTWSSSGCSRPACSCRGPVRLSSDEAVVERIDTTVQDLDMTIRDIRVDDLRLQYGHEESLRNDVHDVARSTGRCSASRRWCGRPARWTRWCRSRSATSCSPYSARRCPTWPGTPSASAATVEVGSRTGRWCSGSPTTAGGCRRTARERPAQRAAPGRRARRHRAAPPGGAARHDGGVAGPVGPALTHRRAGCLRTRPSLAQDDPSRANITVPATNA